MASTLGKKTQKKKPVSSLEEKAKSFGSLVLTLIVVLFVQSFFIQGYSTPTGSMLNTILIGDKMFFNQFLYGGSTPRNIPFTEIRLPYIQLPAIRDPRKEDIVNFEFPGNREEVDASMKVQYLKRCVGEPGDTIEIKDAILYVNGNKFPETPAMQYSFRVYFDSTKMNFNKFFGILQNSEFLEKYEITDLRQVRIDSNEFRKKYLVVPLPIKTVEEFRRLPYVKSAELNFQPANKPDLDIFPKNKLWNRDNYGPLRVPVKGDVVTIDAANYGEWDTFIKREGHNIELRGGKVFIDNKETDKYTVENNYYFMMGDNRHNSLDSRFWGFVKREAMVGKAWFTYFSWNSEIPFSDFGKLLGSIRWDRIGMPIK
ncbi:MAG: signal peptidase I [Ignavibacteria bacterium]|nr:signal peptidase I [Ignavibacteria bacterium]